MTTTTIPFHDASCSTCGSTWACACAPGQAERDRTPTACLFDGRECDDCALARLDAEDGAEHVDS